MSEEEDEEQFNRTEEDRSKEEEVLIEVHSLGFIYAQITCYFTHFNTFSVITKNIKHYHVPFKLQQGIKLPNVDNSDCTVTVVEYNY